MYEWKWKSSSKRASHIAGIKQQASFVFTEAESIDSMKLLWKPLLMTDVVQFLSCYNWGAAAEASLASKATV